jgi:L-Ala-D/L-Glu epimerase
MKARAGVTTTRLRNPFGAAWGEVRERELLVLALEDSEGHVGYGEAAPLPGYDPVSLDDVEAALRDCYGAMTRGGWRDRAEVLADCGRLAAIPQALAALDLALWDLEGKRAGEPVWRLLGAEGPGPVPVNHTISAADRAGAAREASRARAAGFPCVKVKVGIGDDAGRLAAVRAAAGPEMAIRLDANGAWSVEEAQAALRVLAPAGLELCEEPVRGVAAIAELASLTDVRLAIDESGSEPGALGRRCCQAVCLKLGRCGGLSGLLEATARARRAGYEVYLASALEGPIGIAGALHAATAIGVDRPCGLATLDLFERPHPGLAPVHGTLSAPDGPGLGDGLIEWYGSLAEAA